MWWLGFEGPKLKKQKNVKATPRAVGHRDHRRHWHRCQARPCLVAFPVPPPGAASLARRSVELAEGAKMQQEEVKMQTIRYNPHQEGCEPNRIRVNRNRPKTVVTDRPNCQTRANHHNPNCSSCAKRPNLPYEQNETNRTNR